jgi:methyl-accepting chemotaxis protein
MSLRSRLVLASALIRLPAGLVTVALLHPGLLGALSGASGWVLGAILLVGAGLAASLASGMARDMCAMTRQIQALAQGNFDEIFDARGKDELSDIRRALQALRTRLGFELSDTRRTADASMRIQTA